MVRKAAGLSMRAFADRIGIKSSSVSLLETGKNNPSERTIRAICSEFHVSRVWLETGIGEMQDRPIIGNIDDSMVHRLEFPDIMRKLIETYEQLDTPSRVVLTEFTRNFFASLVPKAPDEPEELTIDQKVEAYRAELEMEKGARVASLVTPTTSEERKIG